jgi:hypothetical protein
MLEFCSMPIFKAGNRLIYYAHVPKCGGSAVAWYLRERFGKVAFSDTRYTQRDKARTWSKTSPQHIDSESLSRLFPPGFFDATFAIVRHPVPRLVSAYHFQLEVEKSISAQVLFSDWLEDIAELRRTNPFLYDNHVRPMTEIVPEDAQIFHLEHGLDALIPWFDAVTGEKAAPRAIRKINEKGAYSGVKSVRITPGAGDLAQIAEIYAADFARFGYDPEDSGRTSAAAPVLPPEFAAERDAALRRMSNPLVRLRSKLGAKLRA